MLLRQGDEKAVTQRLLTPLLVDQPQHLLPGLKGPLNIGQGREDLLLPSGFNALSGNLADIPDQKHNRERSKAREEDDTKDEYGCWQFGPTQT